MFAIGIGHYQGDCATWNCISSAGDGRCSVLAVIGGDHRDAGCCQIERLIFPSQRIARGFSIGVVGRVETGLGDGGITGTVDSDEATVAAGTGHTAHATTGGRSPASSRGFKGLGRVGAPQDRLLQRIDIIRRTGCSILRQQGFCLLDLFTGFFCGAQGELLLPPEKTPSLRRDDHCTFWHYITFSQQLAAAICGQQIDLSFQLGNGYALCQGNAIGDHFHS